MEFDTRALATRPAGPVWKAFRRAARAGEHGEDLAAPGFRRFRYGIDIAIFVIGFPAVPIGLLVMEGITLLSVSISTLWIASLLVVALIDLRIRRLDHWAPKTRERFQLIQFARSNGLVYEPSPDVARPAADLFDSASSKREHLDLLLRSSGTGGFQVANYREVRDWDDAESYWLEAGYVMIPLRRSYPRFFASTSVRGGPRKLRSTEAVGGPGGLHIRCAKPDHPPLVSLLGESRVLDRASAVGVTEIEIVGEQLFLVRRGGFLRLTSPKLWERIEAVLDGLDPFRSKRAESIPDADALRE